MNSFDSIDLLTEHPRWLSGFEVGIVYALMTQGVDAIVGEYHNDSQEQLFLMASQLGYEFEWQEIPNHKSRMLFCLKARKDEHDPDHDS